MIPEVITDENIDQMTEQELRLTLFWIDRLERGRVAMAA